MNSSTAAATELAPRWWVRGDIDGFFGLALDNLVQLLVIAALCRGVLGFGDALLFGEVLPGAAVSLLIGNLFYAWQAMRLARREGRNDVCALPYGINTVSLFAHVFLVMLPAKLAATAAGAADPAILAWQAGLVACAGSGLIELLGSLVVGPLRRLAPRAALLSTLAGIAMTYIALGFLFRSYARPVIGLGTLAIVLLVYFGRVKFRGNIPGGLVAVMFGIAYAWSSGLAPIGLKPAGGGLHLPVPVLGDLLAGLARGDALTYFSVILPMGLFTLIGSLQNLESAEAAGDRFDTRSSLAVNGVGSLAAALFGSCFPTTLYIGHPGWKAMGARAGYSILNGGAMTLICLTGTLGWIAWAVPIEAGMAIILWIGIVIAAQAFQATPRAHAPAVVVGLLPGIAGWSAYVAKASLHAAGMGLPGGVPFSASLIGAFAASDLWIDGALRLEQGFVLTAMILSAATVGLIERRFRSAAAWCLAGAAFSALGLMHSYRWTAGDTVLDLSPAWSWVEAYLVMAGFFFVAPWVTRPTSIESVSDLED